MSGCRVEDEAMERLLTGSFGYNPVDAALILRAEIWPMRPRKKRTQRELIAAVPKEKAAFMDSGDHEICLRVHEELALAGFCPPPWVSEALAASFGKLRTGDKRGFLRQFNIETGRGKTSRKNKRELDQRNILLVQDVLLLSTVGGLSVEDACELLREWLRSRKHPSPPVRSALTADSIRNLFYGSRWAIDVRSDYLKSGVSAYLSALMGSRSLSRYSANVPEVWDKKGQSLTKKLKRHITSHTGGKDGE